VTMAVLPRMSNRERGFFKKVSFMTFAPTYLRHPEVLGALAPSLEGRRPHQCPSSFEGGQAAATSG
jgi:hypothetical protein